MKVFFTTFAFLFSSLAQGATPSVDDVVNGLKLQTSPFEACKDVSLLSRKDYEKNREFWQQTLAECPDVARELQILPDAGFLSSFVGYMGEAEENLRSVDFLNRLGEEAKKSIIENNRLTKFLLACAKNDNAAISAVKGDAPAATKDFFDVKNCGELLSSVNKAAAAKGKDARIQYALVKHFGSNAAAAGRGIRSGLSKITSLWGGEGFVLPLEKQSLSAEEKAQVDRTIQEQNARMDQEFQKKLQEINAKVERLKKLNVNKGQYRLDSLMDEKDGRYVESGIPSWYIEYDRESSQGKNPNSPQAKLHKERVMMEMQNQILAEHSDAFHNAISAAPIVAYLEKGNPNAADIAKAADALLKNGEAELKKIEDTMKTSKVLMTHRKQGGGKALVTLAPDPDAAAKNMMEFMKYGPLVRKLLEEDKMNCRTATGLANYISGSEMRNATLIVGGMLAGGAVVGLAAGAAGLTAAGITGAVAGSALIPSGVLYYNDYDKYAKAQQRTFNVAHTIEDEVGAGTLLADTKEFEAARNNFTFAVATAGTGIDVWGLGLGKGALMGAALAGRRLVLQPASKLALAKQLRTKGLGEAEIKRLIDDIASADPNVSGQAVMKIMKETGIDSRDVRLARELTRTRLVNDQNVEAFDNIMARLKKLPESERQLVYARVEETLKDVNSAKINAGNRTQALEAIVAGAMFGAEPKRIASVVGEWEDGLEGLAKAFDAAGKHLKASDVTGMPADLRLQTAFKRGLDDLRSANPELKAIPEDRWAAMKDEMSACPLGTKK